MRDPVAEQGSEANRDEENKRVVLGMFVVTGNLIRVTVVKTDGALDDT